MTMVTLWSLLCQQVVVCGGRIRGVGLALVALTASVGCFGEHTPPPAKLDALADLQKSVEATSDRIMKNPKLATAEVSLLLESVEGYAKSYGEPFVEFRELVKDVLAKLQGQTNKLQIESEVGRMKSRLSELAKSA